MTFTPLGKNIAITPDKKVEQIGSVFLPEKAQEVNMWGVVSATGGECEDLVVGDAVFLPKHIGTRVILGGTTEVIIVGEDKVLAKKV